MTVRATTPQELEFSDPDVGAQEGRTDTEFIERRKLAGGLKGFQFASTGQEKREKEEDKTVIAARSMFQIERYTQTRTREAEIPL